MILRKPNANLNYLLDTTGLVVFSESMTYKKSISNKIIHTPRHFIWVLPKNMLFTVIGIWMISYAVLPEMTNSNSINHKIKLTVELEKENRINFLDFPLLTNHHTQIPQYVIVLVRIL